MPMMYRLSAIPESKIPIAGNPVFQHLLETYASETNKTASIWREFAEENLSYRPHKRSGTVMDIMKHQILSERRFFAEFLGLPEPEKPLPAEQTVKAFCQKLSELAGQRLDLLAEKNETWWLQKTRFFDVERQRIWIFWRRVLHSAHHRTQLAVYLRLLDKPVPAVYGPTADATWIGADPTYTEDSSKKA
jgi:uncharacterized damage-inducible protein DinB